MWKPVEQLVAEIKKCEAAGATTAAVTMAYVCIDTMAFLTMPATQTQQTRKDFIAWVDAHLEGHPSQPYQYRGIDVYAARCAVLHTFGSEAEIHRNDPSVKMFGYTDGGMHKYDPSIEPRLVLIGTASFLNDVTIAVLDFLNACRADKALRATVEARLPKIFVVIPHPAGK